jgi:tRNA modification GTPase
VVLAVKELSPTPYAEIHCHGGRQVVELLLENLGQGGARVCDATEFLRFADPLRQLAEEQLLRAPTVRTASLLLQACQGHYARVIHFILSCFDNDYSLAARDFLGGLLKYTRLGRHLVEPWRVTVAGAPNVGKSSLVNALAGYQRCIVSPTPGTTRDVVTTTIALDGWPVELADTAGVREADGTLEGEGIERARSAAMSADLCLWVLEASAEPVWPDVPSKRVLFVINKVDLPAAWNMYRVLEAVHVSAQTGAGLPDLCNTIVSRLVPHPPGPDEAVPFTPELCDAIEEAHAAAVAGRWDDVRRVLSRCLSP